MSSETKVDFLLTAEEAWPAFERAVLAAERRVVAGFRVFDPGTKLRSEEALEIGKTWLDLIGHIVGKGVSFELILADFDPIIAPDMHQLTWETMEKFDGLRENLSDGATLKVTPVKHPAEAGSVARTALWPKVWSELKEIRDWLNGMEPDERRHTYKVLPGTHDWLTLDDDGMAVTQNPSAPPLYPVSHHQKLAVIDSAKLYVGGLDLNPRRYDTLVHHRAAEETWHDVQVLVHGPAAVVAERHLDSLIDVVNGRAEPPEEDHGFCSTISRWRKNVVSMAPEVVRNSILERTLEQVERAERCIYFETQFLRDRELAEALCAQAKAKPGLELLVILPAAPEVIAFEKRRKIDARFGEHLQADCVEMLQDAFKDRCYFASPAQKRPAPPEICNTDDRACHLGAPLIYVHAKVSIFDRRATMVTSANLNSRSLHWDTEAGFLHEDADFSRDALERSLTHWMSDAGFDVDAPLVPQVREQAKLDSARQPDNRGSFLLPYDVSIARAFGHPVPGAPPELV